MKFICYHAKGVQGIVKWEILEKLEAVNIEVESPKYTVFQASVSIEKVLELRTPDDVHLLLEVREFQVSPGETEVVRNFPLEKIKPSIKKISGLRQLENSFSVTFSRYRAPGIDPEALEQGIARKVEQETGYRYNSMESSNFDFRIHVDQNRALFSCRIRQRPLYYRDYWLKGMRGSLKTSVASCMVKLIYPYRKASLVDNFCGAGTILCEAAEMSLEISGGDIEEEAVGKTRRNLPGETAEERIEVRDARSTDLPDNCFDLAVSNLPWGDHLDLEAPDLYERSIREYSRIIRENGRICLLGNHPKLAEKHLEKKFPDHRLLRLQVGLLGQQPVITAAIPEGNEFNLLDQDRPY